MIFTKVIVHLFVDVELHYAIAIYWISSWTVYLFILNNEGRYHILNNRACKHQMLTAHKTNHNLPKKQISTSPANFLAGKNV